MWFAPSLGCFPVKERFEGKDIDGTLKHVFEREAVTISVGDPPDELFRAPSGYTEVAPSVQLSKQFTLEQHQATAEDKNFWAGLDEMYNRSRAFKRQ